MVVTGGTNVTGVRRVLYEPQGLRDDPQVHREILPLSALTVGLATSLALTVPLARGDAKPKTIAVSEIKDGMKGYGLTVFKGTVPERFDVEVVGILHGFRPAQELILVKTKHPRLDVTKNVRGMSGSPIYLDGGRLAGAYAYSWTSFQVEPVAGVTPIAPMLTEMRRPIPPGFWPLEGGAPLPAERKGPPPKQAAAPSVDATTTAYAGAPGSYDLEAHARQIADRVGQPPDATRPIARVATPLMLSGMTDRSAALVGKLFGPLGLEPVQAGGGGGGPPSKDAPLHYVDGGALGVQLARGDVSLMGMGTVTYVEGARVAGFGHPMMEAGVTALPTAIGNVTWIFASAQHSTKMGDPARSLGALVQDRQSSVIADESKVAPTFAVHVDIRGAPGIPKRTWDVEIAEERFVGASLTASVIGSIVDASVNERRDVTWKLESKLTVRGHGTIALEDFGIAVGGMPDAGDLARSRLVRAIGDVLNNPWERARVLRVDCVLTVDYTRDAWRLRGVDLLDPVVDAGQKARIRLHLHPVAGPPVTRVVELTMPDEVAGSDVDIEIAPGYTVAPEVAAPESLRDLLANATKQSATPRSLVLQAKLGTQGVSFRGHVADRLPSFALDALRPKNSDNAPEPFASYQRVIIPLEKYVEGHDKVRVKVRPVLR